jgi:hypothetical protein
MGRLLSLGVPGSASSKMEEGARSPVGGRSSGFFSFFSFLRVSRILGSRISGFRRRKGLKEMERWVERQGRRKGRKCG